MKAIHGITIMEIEDNPYMFCNLKNNAVYIIKDNNVTYKDPFGNSMSNTFRQIRINGKSFELNSYREEVRLQDGKTIILLPKEDIQYLANKTFFNDEQSKIIDFLTNTIIPQ
ncbi:hypothetical protein [Flavobacterium hydrophilum]|uniref:Uncharacterized protein n=1 Tax=Flavobacterium hydrophilum TaxID=2211445 RepID=A0A2V4C5N2_9FLAO|nr:hypothetical protein [Flavobacterium hydrophilum]PXY46648.1 hypothetical protein DMB68_05645 [Flavobacterium hydrophilum]